MKKLIVGALTYLIAFHALSGQVTGKVKRLHLYQEMAYVEIYEDLVKPECATNIYWDFTFDPKSPLGALTYSTLLTALQNKKTVEINGHDSCTENVMNFDWLIIADS